jgi:group II intron reverse transcriptase/maturase
MNESWKSDSKMVPKKLPNKSGTPPAEAMEGSTLTEGNTDQQNMHRTQDRERVPSALERVRQSAKVDKGRRFTTLHHHIYNTEALKRAYLELKRDAAAGVDGETWEHYGQELEINLNDLTERLKRGAYRAKPVRRVYIPKADGRQRPLGVTALEDKIVQRATVEVLNAIYEVDFLGFSYGFRPGRSQHNALDALTVGIEKRKVSWVLDADLRSYFDSISHKWLVKFIEHRIADKRVIRLIQKWLKAGVLEDGKLTQNEIGSPQGGSASPLMANIYLHYVFDLWTHQWRQKKARGNIIIVRFCDDFVAGFQYKSDAVRFQDELRERLTKFGLELHPEKTRLIEFGRYATLNRKERGQGKPETFSFLGLTHICGITRNGEYAILRHTEGKRLQAKINEITKELKRRMHEPIKEVGAWLKRVINGHVQYYGVPRNYAALRKFRYRLAETWYRVLRRRSQKTRITRERMTQIVEHYLPKPRIYHPYPNQRLRVIT